MTDFTRLMDSPPPADWTEAGGRAESAGPFDGLGRVLRELRADRRLTQAQLAERARVSKAMLSLYEREKQRPHLDTLGRLLEALRVRLSGLAVRLETRDRDARTGAESLPVLYALRGRVHRGQLVADEEEVRLRNFGGEVLEPRASLVLLVPTRRPLDATESRLLSAASAAGYRAELA